MSSPSEREPVVEARRVATEAERDACYLVRMVVFVEEQKVPPWEEMDAYDETAAHYLAEIDGQIVGTARLVDKGEYGKIGRVAVLKEHRGEGVGRALMLLVMEEGFRQFEMLELEAQLYAIPFYERLGFVAEGKVFLDANIEHRLMKMRRPPTS